MVEVLEDREDLVRVRLDLDGEEIVAAAWPAMLGPLEPGNRVVVNVTGIELGLGTGGEGFILWNLDGPGTVDRGPGHVVKMRYTPWQTEVMVADAPESDHHEALRDAASLDGIPVVACGLHSQVAAVAAGLKASAPGVRVGYLMTDGAALPLSWSELVRTLRAEKLIDVTCTAGHAFGGDLEAVNIFSGLTALRVAARVDAVVVAMGPGVVGTGTVLGFTAMEQGQVLDATTALGGRAIAALRISFVDLRERHLGISHHSLTALMVAARERATVVLPRLHEDRLGPLQEQLTGARIRDRHDVVTADGEPGIGLLRDRGLRPSSMGRRMDETPELFLAGAAAGVHAAFHLDP